MAALWKLHGYRIGELEIWKAEHISQRTLNARPLTGQSVVSLNGHRRPSSNINRQSQLDCKREKHMRLAESVADGLVSWASVTSRWAPCIIAVQSQPDGPLYRLTNNCILTGHAPTKNQLHTELMRLAVFKLVDLAVVTGLFDARLLLLHQTRTTDSV